MPFHMSLYKGIPVTDLMAGAVDFMFPQIWDGGHPFGSTGPPRGLGDWSSQSVNLILDGRAHRSSCRSGMAPIFLKDRARRNELLESGDEEQEVD